MPPARAAAPSGVGRHGVALARFARAGGRTYLKDSFFKVPLQLIRPLYPEGVEPAHMTLLNPTGGHVGGDRLALEIELGEGARVLWTTQGATKIYRSLGAPVSSTAEVEMRPGSGLELLPDPIIPFKGSIYAQETRVRMAEGAKLLYGESLCPGRAASGERFDYSSLELRLSIDYAGAPLLHEAMRVNPSESDPERLGLFEPYPYLGSFYVVGGEDEVSLVAEQADALLARGAGLIGGCAPLAGPGALVRWLAGSPEISRKTHFEIWSVARKALFGQEAAPLRKF